MLPEEIENPAPANINELYYCVGCTQEGSMGCYRNRQILENQLLLLVSALLVAG